MTAAEIENLMLSMRDDVHREVLMRFFKTERPGDYGYGDNPHDLMHKAVGWMLREMGKGCGVDLLREFLEKHIDEMSRTTLRYAIEKMDADERQYWLNY